MTQIRTDLALEAAEYLQAGGPAAGELSGVVTRTERRQGVSVTEVQGDQELTLELRVAPDDMGKVIGRQGRNAKEIRTVVRSYAQRTGVKVSVDIED